MGWPLRSLRCRRKLRSIVQFFPGREEFHLGRFEQEAGLPLRFLGKGDRFKITAGRDLAALSGKLRAAFCEHAAHLDRDKIGQLFSIRRFVAAV